MFLLMAPDKASARAAERFSLSIPSPCYAPLMDRKQSDDQYPEKEAERRRDAVLKHMLSRPPQPHKLIGASKGQKRATRKARLQK